MFWKNKKEEKKEIKDYYKILTCDKCGATVFCEKHPTIYSTEEEKESFRNTRVPEHLVYSGDVTLEEKPKSLSDCQCKIKNALDIKNECKDVDRQLEELRDKKKDLQGKCPHNSTWHLVNYGDWHFHSVTKMCDVCNSPIGCLTEDELKKYLEDHPEMSIEGGMIMTKVDR